jgi:multiple sugar transport system permease protein
MGMVLQPMFAGMAPGARRAFFAFALAGVCLLFAFPVLWLILTSLRLHGHGLRRCLSHAT